MSSPKETVSSVRERAPLIDHLIRMVEHFGLVKGSMQAGAVTFFGFLSFFPVLALAFAVIGFVGKAFPMAETNLVDAIGSVFPGMVGNEPGQIKLSDIQRSAPGIFSVGLLVVLYSGLGWVSAMRDALLVVFELPPKEQPNFVFGKLRDLVTLALVGLTLMLSVAVSGVATSASKWILEQLGLSSELAPLLVALGVVVGLMANMLLFFVLFRLLAKPPTPTRSLWSGALLGALGFEALKQLSTVLLSSTKQQPAFQAFGIALILLIWINYFSRVVMYAASWAHTSREARAVRDEAEAEEAARLAATRVDLVKRAAASRGPSRVPAFAAGSLSALGLVAYLTKRKRLF